MSIGPAHYAVLSALVLAAGMTGASLRRHALGMLTGIGLMASAPLIALTGFAQAAGGASGQALALMGVVALAAQALVAVGVLSVAWRRRGSADVDGLDDLTA